MRLTTYICRLWPGVGGHVWERQREGVILMDETKLHLVVSVSHTLKTRLGERVWKRSLLQTIASIFSIVSTNFMTMTTQQDSYVSSN